MNPYRKVGLTVLLLLLLTFNITFLSIAEEEQEPPIQFSISFLVPTSSVMGHQWVPLLHQQLPKIGIGVKVIDETSWFNVMSRTWEYPVGEPGYYNYIPTYDEGGYDVLFVGYLWGIDWDPTGFFDTASIVPNGYNVYQYSNATFDQVLGEYTTTYDANVRIEKARVLQHILYEDLPAISLFYRQAIIGVKEGLTGLDPLLITNSNPRYEFWDDPSDHEIIYASPVEFQSYNVFKTESRYDNLWMAGIYGSLFVRTQDTHEYVPVIAENYTISADGKDITVNINPNAKFSDGNPVTAEDVKFSYELYMTPEVGSYAYNDLTYFLESNDSVEVVDSDTIIFHLKQPYAFALGAVLSYGIIEKSKVEQAINDYGFDIFDEPPLQGNVNDSLVTSCGPFVLTSFDSENSTAILIPNPYYVGDLPKLNKLTIKTILGTNTALDELKAGNVDVLDFEYLLELSDFSGVTGIEGIIADTLETQEMSINMRHPYLGTGELTPLGTPEAARYIRKAISFATPRQLIVEELMYGLAVQGVTPMPKGCIGFDDTLQPYPYNLTLAIQMMEKAGFDMTETNTQSSSTTKAENTTILISLISLCWIAYIVRSKKK